MKTIFDEFEGQVVPLGIHMFWPGPQDSFFYFDSLDAYARRAYYGFNYVPTFRFDGKYIKDPSDGFATYDEWYAWVRSTLDSLVAIPSPIRINLDQYWSADMDSVYTSFDIVCVDSIEGSFVLFYGVSEYEHLYKYTGPAYGKRWFNALRWFGSGEDGIPITLAQGDSLHFDWVYPIWSVFSQDDKLFEDDQWDMTTFIFVQRAVSGKVQQAIAQRVSEVAGVRPGDVPSTIALSQNAPNPFRSETLIRYSLGKASDVKLSVYTAEGRLVTRLVDTGLEPGTYSASWDGRDRFGREVGSGMYYYKLDTGMESRTGRMVFLK